jgi:hypothetical protein
MTTLLKKPNPRSKEYKLKNNKKWNGLNRLNGYPFQNGQETHGKV